MDSFLQRFLDVFNHRVLANMTPERRARKLAIVNTLAGNTKTDRDKEISTRATNLRALRFKRVRGKATNGACEDEANACKEEVKRCSSVPVEVHATQKDVADFDERDFAQNLLTMPSVSVTNLLEEIEADLPSSYSLANVLDHTLHTVTNLRTWARLSRVGTNCVQVAERETITSDGDTDHINKIKELEREAFIQKTLTEQADKAVSLCKARKRNLDDEDLESVRVLLMAKLRYEAINMELQKLTFSVSGEAKEESSGEIEITDIWFAVSNTENTGNVGEHFVCVAYHKEKLFASHVQSEVINGKLHFPVNFKFDNLRRNFIVHTELYRLNCISKVKKESKVKSLMKIANRSNNNNNNNNSSNKKSEDRDFECIGSGSLRLADIRCREKGKVSVSFNAGHYSSFAKTMSLNVRTRVILNTKMNGFLDLFKDRCWHRLWCCPAGYAIQFWCYPEDKDNGKTPVASVLLPHCRENVQPVSNDICVRPYSFVITYKESENTILLSATSHKDMITWIGYLRSAVRSLEAWAPDF